MFRFSDLIKGHNNNKNNKRKGEGEKKQKYKYKMGLMLGANVRKGFECICSCKALFVYLELLIK